MDSEIVNCITKKLPVTHSFLANKFNLTATECQKMMKEHLSKSQNSGLFLKLGQNDKSITFTISTKESENSYVYSILPYPDYDFIENSVFKNNFKNFPIINCEKTVKEEFSTDNPIPHHEVMDIPLETSISEPSQLEKSTISARTNKIEKKPHEIMMKKVIKPQEKIPKETVKSQKTLKDTVNSQEKLFKKAVKPKEKVVKDVINPPMIKKEAEVPKLVKKAEDQVEKLSKIDIPKAGGNLFDNFEEGCVKISTSMKESQKSRKRKRMLDSDDEDGDVDTGNEVLVEDSFSEDVSGSYKIMKKEDKTYVDEEGFLVTERVSVMHTITPDVDMNNNSKKNSVAQPRPNSHKSKSTKSATAKKQKLDSSHGTHSKSKQTNLLSFFSKKS